MTKEQIYTLTVGLLDDNEDVSSVFDSFLDVAQSNRENSRPWVYLRKTQETQSISGSDTYLTYKTIPTDFRKWYSRFPVVLLDNQGNPVKMLREVPISLKNVYKNDDTKFYADYAAGKLYICGQRSNTYTISLNYIYRPALISAADGNSWDPFPDEYQKILAFDVAAMYKLGVDYDLVNAAQADSNAATAELIYRSMSEWDTYLAESSQQGVDYGMPPIGGFTDLSDNVNNLLS